MKTRVKRASDLDCRAGQLSYSTYVDAVFTALWTKHMAFRLTKNRITKKLATTTKNFVDLCTKLLGLVVFLASSWLG